MVRLPCEPSRAEMDVIRAGRADRQASVSGSVPREDFDAAPVG